MTTTDSRGILYLEATDNITPFATTINALQSATSNAIETATRGPLYAANNTERDDLLVQFGSSSSNPLWVDVAGTLYRHAGSGWQVIASTPSAWTNLTTYGTIAGSTNTTLQTMKSGVMAYANGIIRPNSGTIPAGESTSVGVINPAHAPASGKTATLTVSGYIAGHSTPYAPRATLRIASSGNMTVIAETTLSWIEVNDSWPTI